MTRGSAKAHWKFRQGAGCECWRVLSLQSLLERQPPVAQGFSAVRFAGKQPKAVGGQPFFQQAGRIAQHAGQDARAAPVQSFLEGITLVFVDPALAEQLIAALAGRRQAVLIQSQRAHRQEGQFVERTQGTLAFGVKEAHFLNGVAEKFQPDGLGVTGREDVQNIAAPGHVAGARHQGNALIAPFHGLIQDELRRVFAAAREAQTARIKKMQGHIAQQHAFHPGYHATRAALGQSVQRGHAGGPTVPVPPLAHGGQAQTGTFPYGLTDRDIAQGKLRQKKRQQGAGRVEFLTVTGEQHRAAPLGQSLAGQTATRGHAAALQIELSVPACKQCAEILHGSRQEKR